MAKLKGLIDFEGTLGGITAYTRNGERILRQATGADKKKILQGKNYVRTRENMMEFSGAVAAAKAVRQSLTPVTRTFADTNFTGRLQGKYRDMISTAAGKRGQRMFNPLQHVNAILAIPFDVKLHLDSILRVKPVITINAERTAATLSISGFTPVTDIFSPVGATHLELVYAIAVQPSFEYDPGTKKYKRTDGLNQHYMQTISSELIAVDAHEALDISLPAPPIDLPELHADSALVSVLGVCFHQQIGFKSYPLETGKAMGFAGVG
jgi:hypothetical protein